MRIESPCFADGEDIPQRFALHGENVSPPLLISGVHARARSLALIMEDIDSPIGPFTHWLLWNIPPDIRRFEENQIPPTAEVGINGFGERRYGGPCPPSGRHRYRFQLLALDERLDELDPARKHELRKSVAERLIEEALLTGHYQACA